jgi:HAD superfamily hydrolase (TIGR01450 family)
MKQKKTVNKYCLARIHAIALDLDGVVYLGNTPIPGAIDAIQKIRDFNLRLFFVTNNSGKKREFITNKLIDMGIQATNDDVLTSGYATGILVRRLSHDNSKKVLVIGSNDLKHEIAHFGVEIVSNLPCDILVVGFDQAFNYEKICMGLNAIRQNAIFIACNRDRSFPIEGGNVLPGCGAMVGAIESTAGIKPHFEVGKPNTMLLEIISSELKIKPSEILVVGDDCASDIAMANRFGSPSILVKYPFTNTIYNTELEPTMHVTSLTQLTKILKASEIKNKSNRYQSFPKISLNGT